MVRITITYKNGDYEYLTLDSFGEVGINSLPDPGDVRRIVEFNPFSRVKIDYTPTPLGWFCAEENGEKRRKYSFFYNPMKKTQILSRRKGLDFAVICENPTGGTPNY